MTEKKKQEETEQQPEPQPAQAEGDQGGVILPGKENPPPPAGESK